MSLRSVLVTLLAVVSVACNAVYPTEPTATTAISLQVTFAARGRVLPGSNNQFAAISIDSDGVYQNATSLATWTSSDTGIARPAQPGFFVAVAPGTAYVTARYGGFEATAPIAVADPRSLQSFPRLFVNPVSPGLIGNTTQATAVLRLSNSNSQTVTAATTWNSAEPSIATVDASGKITGRGAGTTLITATYGDMIDWFWLSIGAGF
jgi:hypothetical protein